MSTTTTAPESPAQDAQAPATTPESAPAAPAPTPADVAAQTATQQAQTATDDEGATWTLEDAVKEIGRLRHENAKKRAAPGDAAKAARDELVTELGKALGLVDTEAPATPEALTEQVTTLTTERDDARDDARAARVELAVWRAAADHRADAELLLDSSRFKTTLADVDPTDAEAIDEAIKDFVSKNPRFLTQAVGSSSADHAGGSGEGAITKEQFNKMTGHERNELYRRDPATYNRLAGRE